MTLEEIEKEFEQEFGNWDIEGVDFRDTLVFEEMKAFIRKAYQSGIAVGREEAINDAQAGMNIVDGVINDAIKAKIRSQTIHDAIEVVNQQRYNSIETMIEAIKNLSHEYKTRRT